MSHVERDAICLNLSFIWSLFSYSSYSVRGLLEAQNFTNCNSCNPKISIWLAALFIKINQHSKVSYSYKTGKVMHDWCYITFMITKTDAHEEYTQTHLWPGDPGQTFIRKETELKAVHTGQFYWFYWLNWIYQASTLHKSLILPLLIQSLSVVCENSPCFVSLCYGYRGTQYNYENVW